MRKVNDQHSIRIPCSIVLFGTDGSDRYQGAQCLGRLMDSNGRIQWHLITLN